MITSPERTSFSHKEMVRAQNIRIVQTAIRELAKDISGPGQEKVAELPPLFFPREKMQFCRVPLELRLGTQNKSEKRVCVQIRTAQGSSPEIASYSITLSDQYTHFRLHPAYHDVATANEVIIINNSVGISEPEYESLGIGTALLLIDEVVRDLGLNVFELASKKLIIAYMYDGAVGANQTKDNYLSYRKGWTTQIATSAHLGYSREVAKKYLNGPHMNSYTAGCYTARVVRDAS
jgi:hypothetical protein